MGYLVTMSGYTISELSSIVKANAVLPLPQAVVKHLLTDSRQLLHPEHTLFFALKAAKNGHRYIDGLYQAGVRNFVITELQDPKTYPEANFLQVEDALAALQAIAAHHRARFSYPVIAITGSNGKTTVKEWLYQLLSPDFRIVRSPKSYNSQIGVPLSVWEMSEHDTLAIFEAGISLPGEMERLERIIRPDIGVMTSIGEAHDEGFSSREEKIAEKEKLFVNAKQVIGLYGEELTDIQTSLSGAFTKISAVHQQKACSITIPFTDQAAIANAITCWKVLLLLGYPSDQIEERMHHLHPLAMRLELKQGINNCSVINDSYNFDLNALAIALDFLKQQQQHAQRTVILSDLLQTGRSEIEVYADLVALLKKKGLSRIFGIGPAISKYAALFPEGSLFYPDTAAFLAGFPTLHFRDETILLKGARPFAFEQISKVLEQKVHETVLEVNLNALVHNLGYYRSLIPAATKVMAMVKAFSYGSGSFEIANLLQFHRVDYLAVAYADEGVELRKAGITLPIMVMSPEESTFSTMIAHNLEPELYSFRILKGFELALEALGEKNYPVHLKLDTGMRRLGFEEQQVPELLAVLQQTDHLKIKSIFSHLAGSEDPKHDAFSREQLAALLRMSESIQKKMGYAIDRHIANTAAIARFPEARLDMVRLGIGLYGVKAAGDENLQQVAVLKTTVTQLKTVPPGTTIGYGRRGQTHRDTQIATVKIGYADGLFRALGHGKGFMNIKGQLAPIIGSVCMDMCMLDVTGLDVAEGDEAIVFGQSPSIEQQAAAADTIPYELLTSVSQRVKRVYFYE